MELHGNLSVYTFRAEEKLISAHKLEIIHATTESRWPPSIPISRQ